eukprot:CAMPEP_0179992380 /NCGR_PEP_ID=MMETSP0984-20121128/5484_1 /TAXON_ID=483367 /ORGANISM="non described non described, Strain CCMP 2436" /LENGTH=189 /DNA_ID=CAMNT_0021911727 /DNA_START=445 /DNA_END=1012 /DNA_ORIENTATION=+
MPSARSDTLGEIRENESPEGIGSRTDRLLPTVELGEHGCRKGSRQPSSFPSRLGSLPLAVDEGGCCIVLYPQAVGLETGLASPVGEVGAGRASSSATHGLASRESELLRERDYGSKPTVFLRKMWSRLRAKISLLTATSLPPSPRPVAGDGSEGCPRSGHGLAVENADSLRAAELDAATEEKARAASPN